LHQKALGDRLLVAGPQVAGRFDDEGQPLGFHAGRHPLAQNIEQVLARACRHFLLITVLPLRLALARGRRVGGQLGVLLLHGGQGPIELGDLPFEFRHRHAGRDLASLVGKQPGGQQQCQYENGLNDFPPDRPPPAPFRFAQT
jgi:hypothetical protein